MSAISMAAPAGTARSGDIRVDLLLIAEMVAPGSRVLDIGCEEGQLLDYLVRAKHVDGRGIELSQRGVNACVSHGLSVIQGDADTDLRDYPTSAFDYVILSQTLQATRNPKTVLLELLRIGRRAIVSFPNFGYWKVRFSLLGRGRMPVTAALNQSWHETPNIHFCTILDFMSLCRELGITIEKRVSVDRWGQKGALGSSGLFANLLAEQGMFLLSKKS
jgi:methionine biosynthesis protein MetW